MFISSTHQISFKNSSVGKSSDLLDTLANVSTYSILTNENVCLLKPLPFLLIKVVVILF